MEKVDLADHVSETLLINIPVKAKEHARADGILNDPFSVELVDKLDYDFSKFDSSPMAATGVVVRTQYFDEETLAFINRNKGRQLVIVHVGAGLDTRYLRIDGSNQPAVFYELDLPDVMGLREKTLPPAENQHIIKASMFDTQWMEDLAADHPDSYFLFVMEGVVFYFSEERIRNFFCDLADRFHGEIFCDLINVWTRERLRKNAVMKNMEAEFVFGIDDEKEIETWHPDIRHLKTTYLVKRHPGRWGFWVGRIMSNIPVIKKSSKLTTYKLG